MTNARVARIASRPASLLRQVWSWLRQVSGDAAYDNYLRSTSHRAVVEPAHAPGVPLSRAEFYLDSVRRRYSTVSRCC